MGTRVLLLLMLGACWRAGDPPRIEVSRAVPGVHCADIASRSTPRDPNNDAFVAERWRDVITEGLSSGSDVDAMRAHFRVSWAYSKLGEWRDAAHFLERALELAERPARRTRLETRLDMLDCMFALFATEPTITPEGIRDYFIPIDGERYADDVLLRLAENYIIGGRTLAADRVLAARLPPRSHRR